MTNARILLMRHAEKTGDPMDPHLSQDGCARAAKLADFIPATFGIPQFLSNFLHLFGDFSQSAISRQTGGNSVDMSNRYFQNCTGSSNPIRSASKSLILHR